MKNKKRGFSLIEILLTLSVVTSLITAAFFIYNKVVYSNKANQMIHEINSLSYQTLNIAYNSGFDTVNADKNSAGGLYFPFNSLDTSLVEVETPSHTAWNGKNFKSPFGGIVTLWLYVGGTPSIFNSINITVEMRDFDVISCVNIANSQISRKELQTLYINNDYIFNTDKYGNRSSDRKEIKDKILNSCNKKMESEYDYESISMVFK